MGTRENPGSVLIAKVSPERVTRARSFRIIKVSRNTASIPLSSA